MNLLIILTKKMVCKNDRLRFARCYMVLKRLAESAMKPYSIRSYWRMLTLWFHLILYRFSRSREADKGKKQGKDNRTKRDNTRRWNKRDMRIYVGQLQLRLLYILRDTARKRACLHAHLPANATSSRRGHLDYGR